MHITVCSRQNNRPPLKRRPHPNPQNLGISRVGKDTLQMSLRSRFLDEEITVDYSSGPSMITGVLVRERQRPGRGRSEREQTSRAKRLAS